MLASASATSADFTAGYGALDGICLPSNFGRAVCLSLNSSHGHYKLVSDVKCSSLSCAPRRKFFVCNASSNNYRRQSNFSRQNRHGFSRNRNRYNEERDGYDDLEDSESLSSKNGPLLSVSGNQRSQAAATPGPREKEIVELFRKVQAQLRERAALKEEKKVEASPEKNKESETVDSLLKLLRKHSVQQGKKNVSASSNRDFILENTEKNSPFNKGTGISESHSNKTHHDTKESTRSHLGRPKSTFQRKSPVPESKFQPLYPDVSVDPITNDSLEEDHGRKGADNIDEVKNEFDVEEPLFSDEMSEDDDETPEIYGIEDSNEVNGLNLVEVSDLSGMKVNELRALAKSRGMKGFSKLKKNDLVELLSGSTD